MAVLTLDQASITASLVGRQHGWVTGCIKNGGFCIKNDGFCIKTDGFCIETDGFCIKTDGFCTKNDDLNANIKVVQCSHRWILSGAISMDES